MSDNDLKAKAQAARALLDEETLQRQAEILAPLEEKARLLKADLEKAKTAYRAHERSEKPRGLFKGKAAKAWEAEKVRLEASRNVASGRWQGMARERRENHRDSKALEQARMEVRQRYPEATAAVVRWSERQREQLKERREASQSQEHSRGRGR